MTANTLKQKLTSIVIAAIICLVALPLRGATSPLALQSTNTGIYLQSSSGNLSHTVAWGDYDNDGRLDLMFDGNIFHNDGNGQFHQVPSPLGIFSCWIDFDNDGYLDVFSGDRLFRNMGDGTFQQSTNTVFPPFFLSGGDNASVVRSGDYSHDGRPDLFLRAQAEVDGNLVSVLQIWENQGNGQFTQVANQTFASGLGGDVIFGIGDIDNDGWNDIAYDIFNGRATPQNSVLSVWHNNAGNPVFTPFTRVSPDAYTHSYYFSSMALADYNNDGLLDVLAFCGNTGGLAAVRNLGSHDSAFGGNSFTNFNFGQSYAGAVCVVPADYDNDGLIDFAAVTYLTGETVGDINGLYHNDGNDQFSFAAVPQWRASGAGGSSGAWGDYDNDGRIDFFCTQAHQGTNTLYLFKNMTSFANTPPTAPTALVAVAGTNSVQLSWNPATDAQTPSPGLSYNLRIGTSPGTANVLQPSADLATGWRRLSQRGPIQTTFYVMTNLPPGIYYWSVQAIDTAFAGGPFAPEGSFIVGGLSLQPAWVQNVVSNSAVLFSAAIPGGAPASAYFEWGNTIDFGNTTATQD
ncbi:MAG TPA: FG-GAP-like repeat-containing protein, partial [Verrucomicrobiae bacterium]